MKALKDFNYQGIEVKAGEEVSNDLFEPDVYPMLVQGGMIGEDAVEPQPAASQKTTVVKRQRKDIKT